MKAIMLKRRKNFHKTPGLCIWNLNCKTTQNRGHFFYVTSLSLFLDTTEKLFSTFSNINLFQKYNKTKTFKHDFNFFTAQNMID